MKLLTDDKQMKYAYNINNSPRTMKAKKISFTSLEKNFYEDLIQSDENIKNIRYSLDKLKSNTIKESIYANKSIPYLWRMKFDYRNTVLKTIDKDPEFAIYLGRSRNDKNYDIYTQSSKLKSAIDTHNTKEVVVPDFIKNYFNNEDKAIVLEKNLEKLKNLTGGMDDGGAVEKLGKKFFRKHTKWLVPDKPFKLDEQLISSKLDEYKVKYDFGKCMDDIRIHRNVIQNNELKKLPHFVKEKNYKIDHRAFLIKNKNRKENVLKYTMFNKLLSKEEDSYTQKKEYPKSHKKLLKPIQLGSIILNHNTEFDKSIQITNPKIKRDLELINYYGPHYTHCKICNNKNLEFYQNSEPNQTLKLLNYLKKVRLGEEKDEK